MIVSRETKPIYFNLIDDIVIRKHIDSDNHTVLICTNLVCDNFSPFEDMCISECTWCDNPYHCKYKSVSRETFYNIPDIWDYTNFCSAMISCPLWCVECKITTRTRCLMYDIAMDMIIGGEY